MAKYRRETYQNPDQPPKRGHKGCLVVIVLVVVLLAAAAFGAFSVMQDVNGRDKLGDEVVVTVQQGENSASIARSLKDAGVIKYPNIFRYYLKYTGESANLQYGDFTLVQGQSYDSIIETMSQYVKKETVSVTFPEGITAQRFAQLMEEAGLCSAEEFLDVANNGDFSQYEFWKEIPENPDRFMKCEGYLFPDTYDFYVNDDPDRVLEKLLSNFNRKFSDDASAQLETLNTALAERWTAKGYDESYIEAHRMTIYDLVTVASMIEKETASAKESSTIASVIYNRLCDPANYPYLNIDATIVYALGGIDGALTYEDTQIDSPYNTYNRTGLPAGPISNPGLSSISAALNPADTSYYYYALDDSTGLHHFSESYDEHQAFLAGQNDA